MEILDPKIVFEEVARALPRGVHENIIIIGSLAAAYSLFKEKDEIHVRTKDIDCVVSPYISAVEKGSLIVSTLLENGWTLKSDGEFGIPGKSTTPTENLPAMRLYPPGGNSWFIEFLTTPEKIKDTPRWTRITLPGDLHYGLPAFPYMSVTTFNPIKSQWEFGIARPEMIVLANMLEHQKIHSQLIKDSTMKRSNKDLGRALSISYLTRNEEINNWPQMWQEALKECFPYSWSDLSPMLANGIKELINSPYDLNQAVVMSNSGLLAKHRVSSEIFFMEGMRIIQTVEDFYQY